MRRLFPAYSPAADPPTFDDIAHHLTNWGKRVLVLAAVGGLLAGAAAAIGFRGPNTELRLRTVEDSVASHGRAINETNRLLHSNLRISCQMLHQLQPTAVVTPEECGQ